MLRFGYARQADLLGAMQHMQIGPGTPSGARYPTEWMEVEFDLASGRAEQRAAGAADVEFPRFDQRYTGRRTDLTVLLQRSTTMPRAVRGFDTVLTLRQGRKECYADGEGWLAEEHIHVPASGTGQEGAGWILGTAYHWPSERTTLSVFDARQVANGPIARVRLPYALPLGLHGQFVPG